MRSRFYEKDGKTQTLGEWCRELGLPYLRIYMRIERGMTFEEAISKPEGSLAKPRKPSSRERLITIGGRTQTLHAWCLERGVSYNRTLKRILRGWEAEKAIDAEAGTFDEALSLRKAAAGMVGLTFDRLTVVSPAGKNQHGKRLWRCRCSCGGENTVETGALRGGHTRSCGCLVVGNLKHGKAHEAVYVVWCNMLARCNNPNHVAFTNYGGRGITVCDRWSSFEAFYADMGDVPFKEATIERIENSGNYGPGNCRWATRHDQSRNKRTNRWVTIGGETKCLRDWCKLYEITEASVDRRMKKGWTIQRAITSPKVR